MSWHNETCGCAECGNYGQRYNPHAIHDQSCGCAECGNYPTASAARSTFSLSQNPAPRCNGNIVITTSLSQRPVPTAQVTYSSFDTMEEVFASTPWLPRGRFIPALTTTMSFLDFALPTKEQNGIPCHLFLDWWSKLWS
jgi:hypothetical protein